MQYLLVICATVIILYFMYLYSKATEKYVDEPIEQGNIVNNKGQKTGAWVRYKRTHKNGKITYHETNYR